MEKERQYNTGANLKQNKKSEIGPAFMNMEWVLSNIFY